MTKNDAYKAAQFNMRVVDDFGAIGRALYWTERLGGRLVVAWDSEDGSAFVHHQRVRFAQEQTDAEA